MKQPPNTQLFLKASQQSPHVLEFLETSPEESWKREGGAMTSNNSTCSSSIAILIWWFPTRRAIRPSRKCRRWCGHALQSNAEATIKRWSWLRASKIKLQEGRSKQSTRLRLSKNRLTTCHLRRLLKGNPFNNKKSSRRLVTWPQLKDSSFGKLFVCRACRWRCKPTTSDWWCGICVKSSTQLDWFFVNRSFGSESLERSMNWMVCELE